MGARKPARIWASDEIVLRIQECANAQRLLAKRVMLVKPGIAAANATRIKRAIEARTAESRDLGRLAELALRREEIAAIERAERQLRDLEERRGATRESPAIDALDRQLPS